MSTAGTVRIMIGTIAGGLLGFYVMHKVEHRYKVFLLMICAWSRERQSTFTGFKVPCSFAVVASWIMNRPTHSFGKEHWRQEIQRLDKEKPSATKLESDTEKQLPD